MIMKPRRYRDLIGKKPSARETLRPHVTEVLAAHRGQPRAVIYAALRRKWWKLGSVIAPRSAYPAWRREIRAQLGLPERRPKQMRLGLED